jgi:hypothetical protein
VRPGRIVALVIGSLMAIAGAGMLLGAAGIGLATAVWRDDDGYYEATLDRIDSSAVAVTTDDLTFDVDAGPPDWFLDLVDLDVRLRVSSGAGQDVFVGIARTADVDAYLAEVDHDVVVDVHRHEVELRNHPGGTDVTPPAQEPFWEVSSEGPGTQTIEWKAEGGHWTALVMNADASPGVVADVDVAARSGILVPLAFVLLGSGLVVLLGGVALIVWGAVGLRRPVVAGGPEPGAGPPVVPPPPPPGGVAAGSPPGVVPGAASGVPPGVVGVPAAGGEEPAPEPVSLTGALDPGVSRWQWLVKWFLAIPHLIVLFFLWIAFAVVWIIALFAVLFTGRYPRSLFDFSVGVLRWTWRVHFYAFTGGLGTDQYPPFSLDDDPSYPARLDVAYPEQLSRGLVLVKWWLLAIPHYLLLAVFLGSSGWWVDYGDGREVGRFAVPGLLGVATLIAAVALLFRGRHIRSLFDLIVGVNRWILRVAAYVALMTDRYPPFRLDQGEVETGSQDRTTDAPDPSAAAAGGQGSAASTTWGPPT